MNPQVSFALSNPDFATDEDLLVSRSYYPTPINNYDNADLLPLAALLVLQYSHLQLQATVAALYCPPQ